eukprot:TRINITY_DN2646_c0_g1_i2.p1 TRINITY_DN2646_c0_g1~~TRINITY_DN2646_c0_g1_i2.p1  ORF type:complete len:572 (-),score=237.67 TRINITY_DN2646_c0_g1_i2:345-2021(-)
MAAMATLAQCPVSFDNVGKTSNVQQAKNQPSQASFVNGSRTNLHSIGKECVRLRMGGVQNMGMRFRNPQRTISALEAAGTSTSVISSEAELLEKGRAEMREWWSAQLRAKGVLIGSESLVAEVSENGAIDDAAMEKARTEMRAWWLAELVLKEERLTTAAMDASRAEMRKWWFAELALKEERLLKAVAEEKKLAALEAARAEMRTWWLAQVTAKEELRTTVVMEKAREEMREWWMAQVAKKAVILKQEEEAKLQVKMDSAREEMREWWIAQLAAKEALAAAAGEKEVEEAIEKAQESLKEWWDIKQAPSVTLQGEVERREAMDTARKEMRTWWQSKLKEAVTPSAAAPAAAAPEAEAEEETVKVAEDEVGQIGEVIGWSLEDEIIQRELQRERAKWEKRREEKERTNRLLMDRARKDMRAWWTFKWESKKRAMGWGEYDRCWRIAAAAGACREAAALEEVEISGEGLVLGSSPEAEWPARPITLPLPKVSTTHAKVFGRDKPKGRKGDYVRNYFIQDMGSINGTFVNDTKLRPFQEIELKSGDVITLGDPEAKIVISK